MKKEIVVTLETKELKYDVMNRSHLSGEVRGADGKDYRRAAYMQTSGGDMSAYRIMRSICNASAHLKVELSEYLQEEKTTSNNRIARVVEEDGQIKLTLLMPSNFDNSACDGLGKTLHEYIVCRALSDWFLITDKEDAQDYIGLAAEALNGVRQALYKRVRPERPMPCN